MPVISGGELFVCRRVKIMEKLRIGQMAALNFVSVQTLRHYEEIGLLLPDEVDENTGYRYYDIRQSAKLDMIQYLKSMGMSLTQIKEQLDKQDLHVIKELLLEHREWLEKQMAEYKLKHQAVDRCIHNFERYARARELIKTPLQRIPQRKIFCHDGGIDIYQHNLATYESILRELKKQVILKHVPMVYFCNVGSLVRYKDLMADRFVSTEIFVFVEENQLMEEYLETIPGGLYYCAYCERFEAEIECANQLFKDIRDQGYVITGDYICEVVTEFPVIPQHDRNMFIKLQVPVKNTAEAKGVVNEQTVLS
jgi:DNA-binding transcriptional MerR regulator